MNIFSVFGAVLKDLWQFVVEIVVTQPSSQKESKAEVPLLAPSPTGSFLPKPTELPVLPPYISVAPAASIPKGYAQKDALDQDLVSVSQTFLFIDRVIGFDAARAVLPLGTKLHVEERNGRWLKVVTEHGDGWVLSSHTVLRQELFPQFIHGRIYSDPAHETVVRLRAFIDDCFLGGIAAYGLLPEEYVTYVLKLNGRTVPWPQSYRRLAGTWQRILRGVNGVYIDIRPHAGSIIEYIIDDVGYLGYVHEVSPEETLTVSAVGLTHEHQYTYERFKHDVWRKLHPVFISIV